MAAVFGIDLGETEYFGIGQFTSKVLFYFLEVVHLFFRECQTFFFVVSFQVFDMDDRFRLTVGGETADRKSIAILDVLCNGIVQ